MSAASILGIGSSTDKKGKEYFTYDILTRTGEHESNSVIVCLPTQPPMRVCGPQVPRPERFISYMQPMVTRVASTT